jgi:polyhydroxybutyrate depolymerase
LTRRDVLRASLGAVGLAVIGRSPVGATSAQTETSGVETLLIDGDERTFHVVVPSSYAVGRPLPLLLMLHGLGENGAHLEQRTGMSDKADEAGFIVAYPNALGDVPTWNPWLNYAPGGRNDVPFLEALVEHLRDRFDVDDRRIYVAGHSNGAMMSYAIGAELAETIAAIGAVAGSIGARWNGGPLLTIGEPAAPVSVIAIHGKQDTIVPYDGSEGDLGLRFVSVPDSIDFWVEQNGCEPSPDRQPLAGGNVVHIRYAGCRDDTAVELVAVDNGGHLWPGGVGETDSGISATDLLWDFFSAHPKP